MRTSNSNNPIRDILASFDKSMRDDYQQWLTTWAHRTLAIAETVRGKAYHDAWDAARHDCRSARGDEPMSPNPLPQWFGPRVRRAIGHEMGAISRFPWADHTGVVKVDGVRCFISEPYPWWHASWMKSPKELLYRDSAAARWEHVIGDFAHLVPADDVTASAVHLAHATGCKLVLDRIAWHDPRCIRLTFVPNDLPPACRGRNCGSRKFYPTILGPNGDRPPQRYGQ